MGRVKEQSARYAVQRGKTRRRQQPPKKSAATLIRGMSESASYDDIIYELYVLKKIEEGERAFEEGRVIPHEEVKRRLNKWLK